MSTKYTLHLSTSLHLSTQHTSFSPVNGKYIHETYSHPMQTYVEILVVYPICQDLSLLRRVTGRWLSQLVSAVGLIGPVLKPHMDWTAWDAVVRRNTFLNTLMILFKNKIITLLIYWYLNTDMRVVCNVSSTSLLKPVFLKPFLHCL